MLDVLFFNEYMNNIDRIEFKISFLWWRGGGELTKEEEKGKDL